MTRAVRTARHRRPVDSSVWWLLAYVVASLHLGVSLTYYVVVMSR